MHFDLSKFFRDQYQAQALLEDWEDLKSSELDDYKDDIYTLISTAYSYLPGGHSNYSNPDDVEKEANRGADYEVIDLDMDGDIDAVSVSKEKEAGEKFVASGHDGSSPAKRAVIGHKISQLKKPGFYVEVSGKIKDILLKAGVPVVSDQDTIEKVLRGKEISMNDDGTYDRKIAGSNHTKMLLGKPLI